MCDTGLKLSLLRLPVYIVIIRSGSCSYFGIVVMTARRNLKTFNASVEWSLVNSLLSKKSNIVN